MKTQRVRLLQLWKRKNGVVYEVADERQDRGMREVLLVPVAVPHGIRARKAWKWDKAVQSELEFVG